jgi:hypothetical protein
LNKRYKKQKVIGNIECEWMSYKGQDEVSTEITGFYRKLYEFKEVDLEERDFYDKKKLSKAITRSKKAKLLEVDLLAALNTLGLRPWTRWYTL